MKNEYDFLKILAILLVVLGHITILYVKGSFDYLVSNKWLELLTSGIYIFHMPLFIAISGAIYQYGKNNGKYESFLPFLKNKILRLILPFLFVGALFLAPSLIELGLVHESYLKCVSKIWIGDDYIKHLWYLPALFWIFGIVWIFNYFKVHLLCSFIGSVCLTVLCSILRIDFHYLCFSNSLQYLPYFILGMWLFNIRKKINFIFSLLSLFCLCVFAIGQKLTHILIFDNLFRILLPCSIVSVLFGEAYLIMPKLQQYSVLSFILQNSFAIYLFHVMVIYAMYVFVGPNLATAIMIPLTFVVAILVSIFIAYLLRFFHLSIIIGEK